jgi:hypothetical protein
MDIGRVIAAASWLACGVLASCADPVGNGAPDVEVTTSFEQDWDGWVSEGIDLDDPPVAWNVSRSTDRATGGLWSARLDLENYNDKGKIWIRRAFTVRPGVAHRAEITFRFATSDWGFANLWTIIAGALAAAPTRADDLPYQDHTGNGEDMDTGWVWLSRAYEQRVVAGADGMIHVVIGVWGTWETPRTYYVDDVRVRLTAED